MAKFNLDRDQIDQCRELAEALAHPVQKYIDIHSTVSIERSVLRLLGLTGEWTHHDGRVEPMANAIVDKIDKRKLSVGVATLLAGAKQKLDQMPIQKLATKILLGQIDLNSVDEPSPDTARTLLSHWVDDAMKALDKSRWVKERMRTRFRFQPYPLKYVIVATGNIFEDVKQAIAAAKAGADIIAVIRSTAQSLLDYVPHGATTEGFGGTYATQENFRIMRRSLNEISFETKKYVRLCNYSSGLCMPEIAVMGAQENLDYLLNDAMYGILFRDINMKRTFVDQFFSRLVIARAGIVLQTGEDNYLTTADAYNNHHQVLTSQFINEQLAKNAGIRDEQLGLGHAFEMDPAIEDSLLYEIAMAQLVRDIFPRHPIKYMPPTRHKTGDVMTAHVLDAAFNLTGILTHQAVQLLGMPTEAIHNPHLQDRHLSLENANYIFHSAHSIADEIQFNPNGKIVRRARSVLDNTHQLLTEIKNVGLMEAIEKGMFAEMPRARDGGRGLEGVFQKSRKYFNPFIEKLLPK